MYARRRSTSHAVRHTQYVVRVGHMARFVPERQQFFRRTKQNVKSLRVRRLLRRNGFHDEIKTQKDKE